MTDLFGILITFGPLILIVLLANLAERAREESALVASTPVIDLALPQPATPVEALSEPLQPPQSTVTQAPDSSGTVWAFLAYALLLLYLVSFLVAAAFAALMPFVLTQATPEVEALIAQTPFIARFNWGLLAGGTAITCILGMIVMLRPVRRLLARFIPIDPLSTVHSVALGMISLVVLQMVFTAGVGIDVLADMVAEGGEGAGGAMTITTAWVQAMLFVLMGFVGVGWLIRRGGRATLDRLGIVMPSIAQVLVAIGLGFVMVGVIIALETVSNALGWGFDEDVGRLSEQLLGGLILTVPGILTLGLSAGIGEETLMRGALQPRFGLVLTSIVFALLHGNYGFTLSTLAVLIVGFTLGILRNRANTTSAMIMHATYNCILGFMPFLWQQ